MYGIEHVKFQWVFAGVQLLLFCSILRNLQMDFAEQSRVPKFLLNCEHDRTNIITSSPVSLTNLPTALICPSARGVDKRKKRKFFSPQFSITIKRLIVSLFLTLVVFCSGQSRPSISVTSNPTPNITWFKYDRD